MNNYVTMTERNVKAAILAQHEQFASEFMSEDEHGFSVVINTSKRMYLQLVRIYPEIEKIAIELYPGIHVPEVYRDAVATYASKIEASKKVGSIRISENGALHVLISSSIADGPFTEAEYKEYDPLLMAILSPYELVLQKLANGKLLTPDEADIEKAVPQQKFGLSEGFMDFLRHMREADDDGDNDDEEDGFGTFGDGIPFSDDDMPC